MTSESWAGPELASRFVNEAGASVKGYVRAIVLHQHLVEHLPPPPATVLDVGGGAGGQSFLLAEAGYRVTLLDSSPAMLDRAQERLERLAPEVRSRVALIEADGLRATEVLEGPRFDAVLSHGVLGYVDDPGPMVDQLCRCTAEGGLLSIMTANARTMAVRPALERRWGNALRAFDADRETGVLGVPSRGDTVEGLSDLLRRGGVTPVAWYGVWLFVDWLEFAGATLDPSDRYRLEEIALVELEASRRDPYRGMGRVFHLLGRRAG